MPRNSLTGPDFGKRLAAAREARGLSQTALAEKIGVTPATVSRWENGAFGPDNDKLSKAAKVLHVSATSLLEDPPAQTFEARTKRFVSLRREARAIAAGEPLDDPEPDDSTGAYAFSLDWFRERFGFEPSENSKRFHVFRIAKDERGESMEPTIPRGSVVLMDKEGTQQDGAIYVVRHPDLGGLMCKRVFKTREGLVLESDNRAHRPIVLRMDHDRSWDGASKFVLGRVVWVGFEL